MMKDMCGIELYFALSGLGGISILYHWDFTCVNFTEILPVLLYFAPSGLHIAPKERNISNIGLSPMIKRISNQGKL
jgi:hypothetical protein